MPRMIHHDRMVNLFRRALDGGAIRKSLSSAEWHIEGNCTDPWQTTVMGRPATHKETGDPFRPDKWFSYVPGKAMFMSLDIFTRCRKCEKCRKARSYEWRCRVRNEVARAGRSWFGTLTMTPEVQYRMLSLARAHAASRSIPWNDESPEYRFRMLADTSLKEVTKYVKRIRHHARVPIRTLCVTEKHKSGLPHFHMLVHEVELKPVTHRILSTQWNLGFEKWRLVPFDRPKDAEYLCKYLTKSAETRIRASVNYGKSISTVGGVLTSIKDYALSVEHLIEDDREKE